MVSPDEILSTWTGAEIDNGNFVPTIWKVFQLPAKDDYIYRAESFAMTLDEIDQVADKLKYRYQAHGAGIEIAPADIEAYTSIFSPQTDTHKALIGFAANAKKGSPRETVAHYLQSKRLSTFKTPKSKTHVNPYFDVWKLSCSITGFLGPLPDASYADPASAKRTHPMLPVLYHHFGCVVPSYEALHILSELAKGSGLIDLASGSGYWTYMLRRMGGKVTAVDSMASEYRFMWINDTVKADGVDHLKKAGHETRVLLMVYPITAGGFTSRAIKAFKGDVIAIAGTQNGNRYTAFSDCSAEDWFQKEMLEWELYCRVALPSFAGKDEALMVWRRILPSST